MSKNSSKSTLTVTPKENKTKSFRIGLSFGKGATCVEGHARTGYVLNTKKRYGPDAFFKNSFAEGQNNINNNSSEDPEGQTPAITNVEETVESE